MNDLDFGSTIKGFAPGQKVFARYALQKLLGRGGMGVVWLAQDEELERPVALKFLPEVVSMDGEALRDLKRETRRSLEITHPHIVRIYDFVQDGRMAAISMEFVAGDTLARRKMDQPEQCFSPRELLPWVEQLAAALDHAHRKAQVVHRDLKPANLMLDARGDLKVADFGIAASVSDSVSRVSAQAGSSGTPVYMSPQQMMGERPAVTDDIYAIGATLYDLLTGKPPFYSGNVIAQVQGRVPPSLADRRLELGVARSGIIPPQWEQTIAACLAKDAKARPQGATELLARLRGTESASVQPVAEPPPPAPPAPATTSVAPARPTAPKPALAGAAKAAARGPEVAEISPARRWWWAPALATLPLTVMLVALFTGEALANDELGDLLLPLVLTSVALFVFQYLFFLVLLAIRQPWRIVSPWGITGLGAILGAGIGALTLLDPLSGQYIFAGVLAGAFVGGLQGWILHRTAVGVPAGDAAAIAQRLRVYLLGAVAGMIAVTYLYGIHVPGAVQAERLRVAARQAEEQRIAAEQEQLRLDALAEQERLRREADAERDRLQQQADRQRVALENQRRADQRRIEAGPIIADAYRMVFDRAPTAAELSSYMAQFVDNAERDGAWLRNELRNSPEGRKGGRVLVPQEFSTINKAIEAAVAGNVVHVGPGTYREGVYLNKNVSLLGAGRDRTFVEHDASDNAVMTNAVTGITVSGFTFRHSSTSEAENRASVAVLHESSATFRDNIVENSNGNGLHVRGTGRNIITQNIFRNSRWAGITLYGGANVELSRNEFLNNQKVGLGVYEVVGNVQVTDNVFRGNQHNGIWLADGTNVVLQNNSVTSSGTSGINYGGIGIGKGTPVLRGNVSRDNHGGGIWWNAEAAPRIGEGNYSDGQLLTTTP